MKKKMLIAIFIITISALCLCGCVNSKNVQTSESEVATEASEETSSPATEVSEEPTPMTTEDSTSEVPTESTADSTAELSEVHAPDPTAEPTPEATPTPKFLVSDYSATMYAKQNCNLRKGPGTEYDKAGSLTLNETVTVTGVTDNGWFRIDKNGEAYVSGSLLVPEKVQEQVQAQAPATQPAAQQSAPPSQPNFLGVYCPGDNYCCVETSALDYVNQYRAAAGVAALTWNSAEETDCMARAQAMKNNIRLDHSLNGGAHVPGECLASGFEFEKGQGVVGKINAYAADAPHYEIMVSPSYTSMCYANCYDADGKYWNVMWFF